MDKTAFDSHPIWTTLDQLDAAVTQAEQKESEGAQPALNALHYLISAVRAHSEPSDPAPYSAAALSGVNSTLPNATNEVTNFNSNGNITHLSNAQDFADQALNALGTWPTTTLKGARPRRRIRYSPNFGTQPRRHLSIYANRTARSDPNWTHSSATTKVRSQR